MATQRAEATEEAGEGNRGGASQTAQPLGRALQDGVGALVDEQAECATAPAQRSGGGAAGARVWNISYSKAVVQANERWGIQAAIYEKVRRRDGLLIWQLSEKVGEFRPNEPGEAGVKALQAAEADGAATGLSRLSTARHGGSAVEMSDLIDPAREAAWRLDGLPLSLCWKWATVKQRRVVVALARQVPGHSFIKVIGVGTVTRKQAEDLAKSLSLPLLQVGGIPRADEAPLNLTIRTKAKKR